jgi:mono/diheme cytochrome c family protein
MLPWLLLLGACIGTSPEEAAREAQGDEEDGDEEHRPGQPCLVCHGVDYSPGGPVFAVAGTVYLRASDAEGIGGALVEVTDARGRQFRAPTNRVGNFMVEVKPGLSSPQLTRRGRLRIGYEPEYPLSIRIERGDLVQEMESFAWRDGSCAGCHLGVDDTADSVPRVFLIEEGV